MDFDAEVDWQGTNCIKWEFIAEEDGYHFGDHAHPKHGPDRLLPMWIADMDFRCPPAVIEALTARAQQGVFGYSYPCDSYFEAVTNWMARRHGHRIEKEWIVLTPGVGAALHTLVGSFTAPGDKVLVQPPVYAPFFHAIEANGCQVVSSPLNLDGNDYTMNFTDLAQKAADPALKLAILCSPHNPVGRVWTAAELKQFGQICLENDVLVVSDEVHADLLYEGQRFTSFAILGDEFAQNSIICTSASKAFNLAGLKTSNIIVQNERLRQKFVEMLDRRGLKFTNPFGLAATEAAYNDGSDWLAEAMDYIEANYRAMRAFMGEKLPQLKINRPQGTYLVWVDFRALDLDPAARKALLMEKAKVYLNSGEPFGIGGEGFERFNIACRRSLLLEALERIKKAVDDL
jgi:cystathionine beta-lyase